MSFKFNVLVVANRTAGSDELLEAMQARAERDSVAFTLLVPAQSLGPEGREAARETMEAAVERLTDAGLEVEGEVGGADPVAAVSEMWDPKRFDEVIVSTLPGAASKWLQVDLPHRVERITGVPVTHVVVKEPKPPAPTVPAPKREKFGLLSPLRVLGWGREKPPPASPGESR